MALKVSSMDVPRRDASAEMSSSKLTVNPLGDRVDCERLPGGHTIRLIETVCGCRLHRLMPPELAQT